LKTALFLLQSIILGLAIAFVAVVTAPDLVERLRGSVHGDIPGAGPAINPAIDQIPAGARASYRDAVAQAAPSVVNIYANKVVTERSVRLVPNPYLQRFSGISVGPPRQRLEQSLGSGVIVSSDGYVLTNHHVIAGADDIQAVLWDGRVTRASVVGSDRDTDLAVLRIEGSNLPAMTLSEEVPLSVGDVALAIGNPFGMGQTVTLGIISATGRNQLNLSTYEDFIQTDAAINTGNSGGALINAYGELIGINTAVFGRGTGAEGIGFAIPVRTAAMVLDQIDRHGFVVRGWLGLEYVDAPALAGANGRRGVAVAAVYPSSPADQAGLRPGDILLSLDGTEIMDQNDLRTREAALVPGSKSQVSGLRAGVPFSTDMVLAQRPLPRGAS
jgi:serine protease DegQ